MHPRLKTTLNLLLSTIKTPSLPLKHLLWLQIIILTLVTHNLLKGFCCLTLLCMDWRAKPFQYQLNNFLNPLKHQNTKWLLKKSLAQSKKQRKPDKWPKMQEDRQSQTEKEGTKKRMTNWELSKWTRLYQKQKERNRKKNFCSGKWQDQYKTALSLLSIFLSRV